MNKRGRYLWQTLIVGVLLLFGLASCSIDSLIGSPTATTAPIAATATTAGAVAPTAAQSGQPLSQPVGAAGAITAVAAAVTPAPTTPAATTGGMALPDVASVAAKVRPATVLVLNIAQAQTRPGRIGQGGGGNTQGGTDVPQGAGTGFIIDPSGIIVTNNHVVEGAQKLTVQLPPPDGREFTATLIGTAPNNDLAVLKIDGANLPTVPLGNSSQLQIGEWVVAIGNALALKGGPTVTAGVVSATGRDEQEPPSESAPNTPGPTLYDLIQTDAAINPGNSGGPLVNMKGEVVGINTLGTTEAQGIGFSISIDSAKPIIQQLIQTGKVAVPFLGIQPASVTPSIAAANGLPRNDGVYIQQVVSSSPAAKSGLQQGDIIFKIDNAEVSDISAFQKVLLQHKPGDTVAITIDRDGTEQTIQVTLGEKPQAVSAATVS